jgi:hypothetical protein
VNSAFDETAVFLADVLRDHPRDEDESDNADYSTEEATALMMKSFGCLWVQTWRPLGTLEQ